MQIAADAQAILAATRAYVIRKSDEGLTVGLHFDGGRYGEASSHDGDVNEAVRAAFRSARGPRDAAGPTPVGA